MRQPTLILRAVVGLLGPDKGLILPREEAERLRAIMPSCEVVEIPDTNHYTIVEAPLLRDTIISFLAASQAG